MPTPLANTGARCTFGPGVMTTKPATLAIFDFAGSAVTAPTDDVSIQIAALPCMYSAWHSYQLKPATPTGPQSRTSFWYISAAAIASGPSVLSLPLLSIESTP